MDGWSHKGEEGAVAPSETSKAQQLIPCVSGEPSVGGGTGNVVGKGWREGWMAVNRNDYSKEKSRQLPFFTSIAADSRNVITNVVENC